MAQKSSSGDRLHRIKTEKRATETWGYQILPTLYSTYQKVPDIFQECAVLCFAFASISMHLNLFGKSALVRTFCHFILNWAKFCMHLILFFFPFLNQCLCHPFPLTVNFPENWLLCGQLCTSATKRFCCKLQ